MHEDDDDDKTMTKTTPQPRKSKRKAKTTSKITDESSPDNKDTVRKRTNKKGLFKGLLFLLTQGKGWSIQSGNFC